MYRQPKYATEKRTLRIRPAMTKTSQYKLRLNILGDLVTCIGQANC